MDKALIDFYYYFHKHQHYFLCHDILEEAWKSNINFSKKDGIVSLILFSTAMYHYRRGNTKGALVTLKKSLSTFEKANDKTLLQLNEQDYKTLILSQIKSIEGSKSFKPVYIPINNIFEKQIINTYPDYKFTTLLTQDEYIINHHKKRDRSDVISARHQAMIEKQNIRSGKDLK
ncbi:DUF309 domain-containing protein [Staphylococcus haemolyticus]|uniref:DUF309 domain-containing protein n=1 Tax=Staphylococcus haemolyticus TaxID=1283 RepID=UPI001F58356B|nr:DUF309 domain-containing protein [Staphylococcus haemolyticus]MCI2934022.1 DUF309 domain-containing protein [Staphylococcus haemolyticus]